MDGSIYEHPEDFDAFRFYRAEARSSDLFVTPSLEYFPWGYGTGAW